MRKKVTKSSNFFNVYYYYYFETYIKRAVGLWAELKVVPGFDAVLANPFEPRVLYLRVFTYFKLQKLLSIKYLELSFWGEISTVFFRLLSTTM